MRKRVILCVLVMMAVACTLAIVSAVRIRGDAMLVLGELRELANSPRPNDSFDRFQWRYGRNRFISSEACTFHFCTYEIDITNEAFARFHLAPYTEMKTWFTIDRGQLVRALVEYRTALKGPNSPVVHVQQGICKHGCGVRFDVNPYGTTTQTWNGLVEFSQLAAQAEKEAALGLNLGCFYPITGCKNIADFLPRIWQNSKPGSVASRFVGLSERLEESHGASLPDDLE